MRPLSDLVAILPQLARIQVKGPWVRAVRFGLLLVPPPGAPAGNPPEPLWAHGSTNQGARYTPKGGSPGVYVSSDPETALKETSSVFDLPGRPAFPVLTRPWVLVPVDGIVTNVLDLTDQNVQAALGTSLQELTGDWAVQQELHLQGSSSIPPTQLLGHAAFNSRAILGLKFPSARAVGHGTNIVVFSDRLPSFHPSYLEVIDPDGNLTQRLP